MKAIAIAVALITLFAVFSLVDAKPKKPNPSFDEWANVSGRKPVDNKEKDRKKKNYEENVKKIDQLNAERVDDNDAEFGVNDLSDLSEDEFKSGRLNNADFTGLVTQMRRTLPELKFSKRDLQGVPKSKDWRRAKPRVVGKVTNQGQCGSCWAFATIGNIEGVLAVSGKRYKSLSEQELIDCARNGVNNGCSGGWQVHAFEWVKKNGIHSDGAYGKYQAKQQSCKNKGKNGQFSITGNYIAGKSPKSIMAAIAKYGPVTALIDASTWQHYKRGISKACAKKLNHAVLIVGYGKFHGKAVWIVRNSWGPGWGMKGYAMVRRAGSGCDVGIKNGVATAVA